MSDLIYIENTNVIELNGLHNEITGSYQNAATVEARIQYCGEDVEGQSWPVTLDYITDSNGDYRGLLDAALELRDGRQYTAVVVATAGSLQATFNCKVLAQTRACE